MHVNTGRHVRQRDDVDVVGRVGGGRSHSRGFVKTRKALTVAIDCLVNPVTNGHSRSGVRESSIDVSGLEVKLRVSLHRGSECESADKGGGSTGLHLVL